MYMCTTQVYIIRVSLFQTQTNLKNTVIHTSLEINSSPYLEIYFLQTLIIIILKVHCIVYLRHFNMIPYVNYAYQLCVILHSETFGDIAFDQHIGIGVQKKKNLSEYFNCVCNVIQVIQFLFIIQHMVFFLVTCISLKSIQNKIINLY